MIIANAIFYNGLEADKMYLGENLVWEKEETPVIPPTPSYGSKVFAGKFTDDSKSSDWVFWPNGQTGNGTSIAQYVDPDTKEFNFEYDGTLTSCEYLLNGNSINRKYQRIDHIPDTSEVTKMNSMFNNNMNLKVINLNDINTSKVTTMKSMFSGITAENLDLSHFDTSNVTDMSMMFYGSYLITLNLSGWDLSKCTTMSSTFYNCTSLTTILGPITGIKVNTLNLYTATALTAESIMVIINGLAEVQKGNIQMSKAGYNKLTPEQIAVATSKGWNFTVS